MRGAYVCVTVEAQTPFDDLPQIAYTSRLFKYRHPQPGDATRLLGSHGYQLSACLFIQLVVHRKKEVSF